jgi:hypothetical protein
MIRSPVGISYLPVSPDEDIGFGPDTEERRVRFASKLEEEAFALSHGDAEKVVKKNLITALKLWEHEEHIKLVQKLTLRDIMIIWVLFGIAFLSQVWDQALDKEEKAFFASSEIVLRNFIALIYSPFIESISKSERSKRIDIDTLTEVRNKFGTDLIFSLKRKNDEELQKIYNFIYSKLPESFREKLRFDFSGVKVDYSKIQEVLKKKKQNVLSSVVKLVTKQLREEKLYDKTPETIDIISKISSAFCSDMPDILKRQLKSGQTKSDKEVIERVKKYYGISE